ncbi:hypothetical protein F7734_53455 [Scytonema sp. UIC 10036]|uniref:hypothetical protein n=1 Tax=Scytonema sp. UIC 10036 TaxID=2304196 RepID=UPI0012DA97EB|nr:hypothetical protein [Scytonema sp. UIC 10036]MUH00616.1 hypothetical protein [Scytonema sp. UIC 10036]
MPLEEKIEKILHIEPCSPSDREKRDESYNPFGRQEKLTQNLIFKVDDKFKKRLTCLPNWAEVVRVTLEHELDTGEFVLRRPQPQRRGRAGSVDGTGAKEAIAVRVSESFEMRIKGVPRWQAKAREALVDRLGDLLDSIPDDLVR